MEEEKKSKQGVAAIPEEKGNEKKIKKETERRTLFKKKQKPEQEPEEKKVRWVQIRLIPIWLRIIIVLVIVIISAMAGAVVGYSVVGDGIPSEVFKIETWKHILDMIQGIE